jgi:hypothetical protein
MQVMIRCKVRPDGLDAGLELLVREGPRVQGNGVQGNGDRQREGL